MTASAFPMNEEKRAESKKRGFPVNHKLCLTLCLLPIGPTWSHDHIWLKESLGDVVSRWLTKYPVKIP